MVRLAAAEQGHALFAAGEQQRVEAEVAAQGLRFFRQLLFAVPASRYFAQFGAVGREQRGAGVFGVVAAFGVDEHWFARLPRPFDKGGNVGEAAFAVVGENDEVAAGEFVAEGLPHAVEHFVRGCVFEVDAQELLVAGDDAGFDGGGDGFVAHQGGLHAAFFHQFVQFVARFVVADNRQQHGLSAQRGDVAGDVGCAARAVFGALDFRHGNGRFGRDAGGVAEPVAVEHHVARYQHARLLQAGFQGCGVHKSTPCCVLTSLGLHFRRPVVLFANVNRVRGCATHPTAEAV